MAFARHPWFQYAAHSSVCLSPILGIDDFNLTHRNGYDRSTAQAVHDRLLQYFAPQFLNNTSDNLNALEIGKKLLLHWSRGATLKQDETIGKELIGAMFRALLSQGPHDFPGVEQVALIISEIATIGIVNDRLILQSLGLAFAPRNITDGSFFSFFVDLMYELRKQQYSVPSKRLVYYISSLPMSEAYDFGEIKRLYDLAIKIPSISANTIDGIRDRLIGSALYHHRTDLFIEAALADGAVHSDPGEDRLKRWLAEYWHPESLDEVEQLDSELDTLAQQNKSVPNYRPLVHRLLLSSEIACQPDLYWTCFFRFLDTILIYSEWKADSLQPRITSLPANDYRRRGPIKRLETLRANLKRRGNANSELIRELDRVIRWAKGPGRLESIMNGVQGVPETLHKRDK